MGKYKTKTRKLNFFSVVVLKCNQLSDLTKESESQNSQFYDNFQFL